MFTDEDGITNLYSSIDNYTWYRNDTPISGATEDIYTPSTDDLNTNISVGFTYTDDAGGSNSITSQYAVNIRPTQTLLAEETTGGFIVSTSEANGIITVNVYADTNFSYISNGLGAFSANVDFEAGGASYKTDSFEMGINGFGTPNETGINDGDLVVGYINTSVVTDFSSPLFSFELEDLDPSSTFELTVSGTMGLDGQNKGDTGQTLVHVGDDSVNKIIFTYGNVEYAMVLEAMNYANANKYASDNNYELATIDTFSDVGLMDALAYTADEVAYNFDLDSILDTTRINDIEHFWTDSDSNTVIKLIHDSSGLSEDENPYFEAATIDPAEELFFFVEIS